MSRFSNVVQQSRDYDQFSFMNTNRETARGHIELLKTAYEEVGNLTKVQPILVNEKLEIIDGQHRFIACKELEEPIYFTVVPGLGVNEARSMNILHRNWQTEDYALSYAKSGNKNYQKYLDLKEDYGISHSILILYIHGVANKGMHKAFREGNLKIKDEAEIRSRLDKLADVMEVIPRINRDLAVALIQVFRVEGYDHKRMLRKLALHVDQVRLYSTMEDNLRMLEFIYNHKQSEDNRLRLY